MPTCTITPMASPLKYRLYREACFDDSPDVLTSNTDDFIIGDRVFVNGTKPGYIQYIGETQFAPGEWAGVVLDEPVGKNDGSVSGVKYFQCEQKRGVFARLHRITRLPCANGLTPTIGQYGDKTVVTTTRLSSTPVSPTGSTKSSSKSSPRGGPGIVTATTTMTTLAGGLRVGDRVLVNATSGVKMGWLRFLGSTEFATGNWAGVELDEPIGKNDGSVAGRRYFECHMRYGLFAPLHKVSKMPSGRNSVTTTTTRVTTPVQGSLQRGRSGSHESLNSSLSSASSLARAGRKPSKPLTSSSSSAQAALQARRF